MRREVCILLAALGVMLGGRRVSAATRAGGESPLASAWSDRNFGFFVGANGTHLSGGRALRFAPNDAVAMAMRYVVELELIPSTNAYVALDGEPTGERKAECELLSQRGVRVDRRATARGIGEAWEAFERRMSNAVTATSFVLVFASSHGVQVGGDPCLLAPDPVGGNPRISVQRIGKGLAALPQGVARLLIVDACRRPTGGLEVATTLVTESAGGPPRPGEAEFAEALRDATGFAYVSSCRPGQRSVEDEQFEHGVFTHFFLDRARNSLAPGDTPVISLGQILGPVAKLTQDWARQRQCVQTPWSGDLDLAIGTLPVGIASDAEPVLAWYRQRVEGALGRIGAWQAQGRLKGSVGEGMRLFLRSRKGDERNALLYRIESVPRPGDPAELTALAAWFDDLVDASQGIPVATRYALRSVETPTQLAVILRTPNSSPGAEKQAREFVETTLSGRRGDWVWLETHAATRIEPALALGGGVRFEASGTAGIRVARFQVDRARWASHALPEPVPYVLRIEVGDEASVGRPDGAPGRSRVGEVGRRPRGRGVLVSTKDGRALAFEFPGIPDAADAEGARRLTAEIGRLLETQITAK